MPRGRMLNKEISVNKKLPLVSVHSRLLFTWMIPHLDVEGKIFGNPEQIKGIIMPYCNDFSIKKIKICLKELHDNGLVLIYGDELSNYIFFPGFESNQNLNVNRESPSIIPNPTQDQLMSLSSRTQCKVKLSKDKVKISKDIPEYQEFLDYCKTLKIYDLSMDFQIEAKYNAWKEAGWRDGYGNQIKVWKTKIQNTMPHFKVNKIFGNNGNLPATMTKPEKKKFCEGKTFEEIKEIESKYNYNNSTETYILK